MNENEELSEEVIEAARTYFTLLRSETFNPDAILAAERELNRLTGLDVELMALDELFSQFCRRI